jgi:hypothetical protein
MACGETSRLRLRTDKEASMAERVTVHNPTGYPPKVVGKRLAPRLQSLQGKTL